MNRLPAIDIAEDLEIVSQEEIVPKTLQEDLKSDPFQRAPPLTNFNAIIEPIKKPRKAVSEKQKTHLANARKLARERKLELKKQQEQAKINEDKINKDKDSKVLHDVLDQEQAQADHTQSDHTQSDHTQSDQHIEDNFNDFLSNMNRYSNLMKKAQEEQEIKRVEQQLKEAEQEAKYYAKFKKMQEQAKQPSLRNKPIDNPKSIDIITQNENQYGVYSNYF